MSTNTPECHITAVILSGGAGIRLGGVDKGLELFKGKPLIEHVIDNISGQVDDLVLCVNRNHQHYKEYGYPLISDSLEHKHITTTKEHYQGPLAGITAAINTLSKSFMLNEESLTVNEEPLTVNKEPLTVNEESLTVNKESLTRKTKQHYILISPCDSPNLPGDYVTKLSSEMTNSNTSSVVVHDGKRTQNLHCLVHSSVWRSLIDFYENGGRAMHQWHKKNGSVEIDFSDQAAYFLNINSANMLN